MSDAAATLLSLRETLGAGAVLLGADVPARNANDWSGQAAQAPLAVIRPADTAGVAAALKATRAAGLAVVPQGGLTGLCGGARPEPGWVALSLERMAGIEEIDAVGATLTVKAGTPLEAVQRAADDAGMFFALDLGARGSCTIGGNISTNAGGNRVIRYGMMRELVLGLEAVLPDGTVLSSMNRMIKNNAGYDLKQLFIGSEGTLGVVTRAVLRLHPKPGSVNTALCALPDYASVLTLLGEARKGLGPQLSAFEVMWPDYMDVITGRIGRRNPLGDNGKLHVLVEAQGTDATQDGARFENWLAPLLEQGLLSDAALAQSLTDASDFWALRDGVAEFLPVLGPHVSYDVGLPVRDMGEFAQHCRQALAQQVPGCQSIYYGHIGDGNMHMVVWVPGLPFEQQPKEDCDRVIYGLVQAMAGTVSAEHGIGTLKKKWLAHARKPEEIALMRLLKQAIDPLQLLNPGKVI